MALGLGGVGEKEGNEFERLWCVRRLLDVIDGSLTSVTPEPPQNAEGVDLFVERLDRSVEAHQCKAENGTAEKWSIAKLNSENVLQNAFKQIAVFGRKFVFVSGDPLDRAFWDLLLRTKHCNGDANLFFETQLTSRKPGGRLRK